MEVQQKTNRHIGKKIWYGFIIFLSGFVLLLSMVGVIGTWVVEKSVSDAAVNILGVVYDTAGSLRVAGQKIDQGAGEVRQISSNVSSVSQKISQNVADQGLLVLLLPPEQEQKLTGLVQDIQDTFTTIREALAAGMTLYQSIDRLPIRQPAQTGDGNNNQYRRRGYVHPNHHPGTAGERPGISRRRCR